MAFVLDREGLFERRVNPETLTWQRIGNPHWEAVLKELVEAHVRETKSHYAQNLLDDWDQVVSKFWHVVPKEMVNRLEHPVSLVDEVKTA